MDPTQIIKERTNNIKIRIEEADCEINFVDESKERFLGPFDPYTSFNQGFWGYFQLPTLNKAVYSVRSSYSEDLKAVVSGNGTRETLTIRKRQGFIRTAKPYCILNKQYLTSPACLSLNKCQLSGNPVRF